MGQCCSDRGVLGWLAYHRAACVKQRTETERGDQDTSCVSLIHVDTVICISQPTARHRHSDFCCSIQISSDVDFSSFKQSASRWKETQSVVSWCEAAQQIERFLLPLKAGGGARESHRQTLHPQQSREQGQAFYYSQLDQLATDQCFPLVQQKKK